MWKRGKRSRSNSVTLTPCCASNVDTVDPAGPPPITITSDIVGRRQPLHDLLGNLDGAHRGRRAHARDRHGASRDRLPVLFDAAFVADGSPGQLGDAQVDVELVLEAQRPLEVERRRDARPPQLALGRVDAQPRGAPQRVFGLLHVAVEPAAMDDAGDVGFVVLDAAAKRVVSGRHGRSVRMKPRRHENTKKNSVQERLRVFVSSWSFYVYRIPTCSGLKNRGSRTSTRSSPSRDNARARSSACVT